MQDILNVSDDDNELLSIDDTGKYRLPEQKSIVLDLANNKIIDSKDFSHIEMIYLTAKEKGITLKQFEVKNGFINSGCRKQGCYGRGYSGFAGNIPIPCTCLFEDKKNIDSDGYSVNRQIIKNHEKFMSKEMSKLKNSKMKTEGLKPLGNGFYGKIKKGTKNELLKYEWKQYEGKWNFSRVYDSEECWQIEDDISKSYNISEDEKSRINNGMERFMKAGEYKAELDAYNRPIGSFFGLEDKEEIKDGEVL
jgi:hypothetical protein